MNTRLTNFLPILLLVLVVGCSEGVDTITYETPQVSEEGETELTIEVVGEDDSALTDYDIAIDGPTSVSESGVTNSQYTFTDLASGTYSITITKDGYIVAETETDVELSEETSAGYSSEVIVVLTEREPPVTVNSNEDTMVETAPSRSPGTSGALTELEIPAGTFPDDVVAEDETVQVSVTRYRPNRVRSNGEGTVQNVFALEPSGVELNNPVEMDIPVALPEGLFAGAAKATGLAAANEIDGISFVLMPGNIPVELVEEEGENGFRRFVANVTIDTFQDYELVVEADLTVEESFSEPTRVAQSACGEGIETTYSLQVGGIDDALRSFSSEFPASESISREVSFDGVDGLRLTVNARNKVRTYTLNNADGGTITDTINLPEVRFSLSTSNCHNSGGG